MPSETFEYLKDFYKNDAHFSLINNPDPNIDYIRKKGKNVLQSEVYLVFDNTEFLNILGVTDEEDQWYYSRFMDNYSYYDIDYYRYEEDFREGYIIDGSNDENKRIFDKIKKYIQTDQNVYQFLEMKYSREVDNIIESYARESTECIHREVRRIMESETKNPFRNFGIIEVYHGYKFKTTLGHLFRLYKTVGDYDFGIYGLMVSLVEKFMSNFDVGNWSELEYNVWCGDYNHDGVNSEIKENLEKILEDLTENVSPEYDDLLNYVLGHGGFGRTIQTSVPNRNVIFDKMINDENPRLVLRVLKNNGLSSERRSVKNLEELYLILNQPELFESIKKTLRKLL